MKIEFVQSPSLSKEYSKNCYEKISDNVVTPIIEFVTGTKLGNVEQELRNGKELVTKSTVGDPVVEICTINFEEDFSPDDLEKLLSPSNGEAEIRAVELFQGSRSNIEGSIPPNKGFLELHFDWFLTKESSPNSCRQTSQQDNSRAQGLDLDVTVWSRRSLVCSTGFLSCTTPWRTTPTACTGR